MNNCPECVLRYLQGYKKADEDDESFANRMRASYNEDIIAKIWAKSFSSEVPEDVNDWLQEKFKCIISNKKRLSIKVVGYYGIGEKKFFNLECPYTNKRIRVLGFPLERYSYYMVDLEFKIVEWFEGNRYNRGKIVEIQVEADDYYFKYIKSDDIRRKREKIQQKYNEINEIKNELKNRISKIKEIRNKIK